MSAAKITEGFQQFVADLRKHASETYSAFVSGDSRTWFSKSKTRQDPAELPRPEFNRDELNELYEIATSQPSAGTVSDTIVLKKQIDFLAQAERASRIRYSSIHRAHVHAHARRYSHGVSPLFSDAPGGIIDNLVQDLQQSTTTNATS